eukprot:15338010-Ditylum_brightwellii.AAC.1
MEGLKKAFEEGIFEARYKEGIGFGVHTLSALSHKDKKEKKTVKLFWAEYRMYMSFDYKWSLVERKVIIKKKGCLPKDDLKSKAKSKYMPLPMVGSLNLLSHACKKHCNMAWGCASGERYKCTLKKAVRKGGQMLIN